jgi:formate/nitrite transporter FocA (FNT family)
MKIIDLIRPSKDHLTRSLRATYLNTFFNAIKAGFMISIGCIAYTVTENHILGSFLFSLGLYAIVENAYNLYTGKIGYFNVIDDWKYLLSVIVGNFIGVFTLCLLFKEFSTLDISQSIVMSTNKSNESILDCLMRSIGCGMLMYAAVETFRRSDNHHPLHVIMPIMCFILCGFEHCIANVGYMALSGVYYIVNLLVMILGNSIGSFLLSKFYIEEY